MSGASRREYLRRIYPRYQRASGTEKQRILDEFWAPCDYNRKYAVGVLNGPPPTEKRIRERRRRSATYGARVMAVLKAVWEAADDPWSQRLKARLPEWRPWIRQRFRLSLEGEQERLRIRARTIDHRLRP